MNDAPSEPPRQLSFPIAYQKFGSGQYNLDFKGTGLLTIRTDGPSYVFHGKKRALFPGAAIDLELGPEMIWNLVVSGSSVTFDTNRGVAGQPKRPFRFYCQDAAAATAVAGLLPARQDEELRSTQDFIARLNALSGARSPWGSVTNIIVVLNVLVFVVMGCLGAGWFEVDSMQPYLLFGASNGAATTDGEWWRLITSMFVHYGIIHLLLNMWALFQVGHFLEKLLGRGLFGLTYLGSGLAGGFVSIMWHKDEVWSAGASGAIFGVYGAILGYLLREKQALPAGIYRPMLKSTLTFVGYNIIYGFRPGVDASDHVGGALGGLVLGWLLAVPVDRELRARQMGRKIQIGIGVVAVLIAAGVLLTPRFDYNVRDEFSWEAAVKDFPAKETDLLQQHQKALAALEHGGDGTAHAAWIEAHLIPLYSDWDRQIMALQLKPGRLTARRRDALHRIFQLRIGNYERGVVALRQHDDAALEKYYEGETMIAAEIKKLKEP